MTTGGVDAQNVVGDDGAMRGGACGGGDARGGHLVQGRGITLQDAISSLTPSTDQESISDVVGLGGGCQADGLDFSCRIQR